MLIVQWVTMRSSLLMLADPAGSHNSIITS